MKIKIPTPPICLIFHSIPHLNLKLDVFAKSIPPRPDTSPQITHMNTPSQLGSPPPAPHSSPNLEATTLLQSQVSSIPKCQSHFPNNALLKVVNFLIPKPPLAIGIHTLSHPNKRVLESPHKKSLCNFSILLATWVGIVKEIKNK